MRRAFRGFRSSPTRRNPNGYSLAHAQGFTAFGGLMQGEGPGEPYLSILERYANSARCPLPWRNDG
jgi:hypothetical protein